MPQFSVTPRWRGVLLRAIFLCSGRKRGGEHLHVACGGVEMPHPGEQIHVVKAGRIP
jgi:hypothetical protein